MFKVIDLFCGAGGTSIGFDRAIVNGEKVAEVVACVNHDAQAIRSHQENFPNCLHFTEDVRNLDVKKLPRKTVGDSSKWILWASLECTHFSNAKSGARNADSRTLAYALVPYIQHVQPDIIMIENVREFMSWGDLDENGKPVCRKKGTEYLRWRKLIEDQGYLYSSRLLNSADFGSHQSRLRYFGCFVRPDVPVVFPEPTHDKQGRYGLPKWKPVREVLELNDIGKSIFDRAKPLSPNTLKRILAGLVKFVAKGDSQYIQKYYGGDGHVTSLESPAPTVTTVDHSSLVTTKPVFIQKYLSNPTGDVNQGASLDEPSHTLTTQRTPCLVSAAFLLKHNSAKNNTDVSAGASLDTPAPTLTTGRTPCVVSPAFLVGYNGGHGNPEKVISDLDEPSKTLTTKDRFAVVHYMDNQFGRGVASSIDEPSHTLTAVPKRNLVSAFLMPTNYNNSPVTLDAPSPVITANRKYHYLVNPQYDSKGRDIDEPCFTLIAKMDKMPPSIVSVEVNAEPSASVDMSYFKDNSIDPMERILVFMELFGIADIYMRMLHIVELKRIQGLGDNYKLLGSQADQKKFIGNAVVPDVVEAWIKAYFTELNHPQHVQLRMFG